LFLLAFLLVSFGLLFISFWNPYIYIFIPYDPYIFFDPDPLPIKKKNKSKSKILTNKEPQE
jgi:hypothetical protein